MAPDQQKAVQQWQEGARDALDTAEKLFAAGKYHHALFFCHLAVEKALKAAYIGQHNELAPYTHELTLLASRLKHTLSAEQLAFLDTINAFNIAARYQEEKLELFKRATADFSREWLNKTATIVQALL